MAGVPDELVDLSAELESLGGGDTRVGEAAVYCRIRPIEPGLGEPQVVTVGGTGSHVLVRDPHSAEGMPVQQALRRYRVSAGGAIGGPEANAPGAGGATQADVFASLGADVFEWWLSGFNATLIAHGQSRSGKTHTLFGPAAAVYGALAPPEATGLVPRLLSRVYGIAEASGARAPELELAVACYEVRHSGVVDLLAPPPADGAAGQPPGHEVATVAAPSLLDALSLLATAQARSLNWAVAAAGGGSRTLVPVPGRASFVLQLTLRNARRACTSTLHIVDLVGVAPAGGAPGGMASRAGGSYSCAGGGATDFERRCLAQQLLAFTRMLVELGQLDPAAARRPLLAARDSKLTQVHMDLAGALRRRRPAHARP
jgi:hypothetical protein